ncbi:MAG: single-stranded-DNA-specific exonuclease RecJ [bacterium]|nr:single-stranded-DNA-specific exonuclease RecJ [bacterium]
MRSNRSRLSARWEIIPADPAARDKLARELEISPVLAQLLVNRGIRESESAFRFLKPSLSDLRQPFSPEPLPDLDRAVERVIRAVSGREKITIFGDYDADGISATAILYLFLSRLGVTVDWELPNRIKEGYGLNPEAVRKIKARGSDLIITVDCGTANLEEIALARELGLPVIVIDHHEVGGELPPALAVVNPKRKDSRFPFGDLAGVGVAYYFLIALRQRLRETGMLNPEGNNLREYLDLVALGTIADMMPLREENRILVAFGLRELAQSQRPGIQALRKVAGTFGKKPVSAEEVGYYLAPRINAGGRLGDSQIGMKLLLAGDPGEARMAAEELDRYNRSRQKEEEKILQGARKKIAEIFPAAGDRPAGLVLADPGWHPGVVGIVASKLMEELNRPVCLIAVAEGLGRGSGRSLPGISLIRILGELSADLETFGGHELAAGFKILPETISRFAQGFQGAVGRMLETEPGALEPAIRVDQELDYPGMLELLDSGLENLEPFGMGNPEPVFLGRGLRTREAGLVGSRHLRMILDWENSSTRAIGFGMAGRHDLKTGDKLDILFCLRRDRGFFRNGKTGPAASLVLQDMRRAGEQI